MVIFAIRAPFLSHIQSIQAMKIPDSDLKKYVTTAVLLGAIQQIVSILNYVIVFWENPVSQEEFDGIKQCKPDLTMKDL